MRSDAKSRPYGDFTPAAVWVEGHLGTKRFLCMTCIEWVVKPAAAMASRVSGELAASYACVALRSGPALESDQGTKMRFGNGGTLLNHIASPYRLLDSL